MHGCRTEPLSPFDASTEVVQLEGRVLSIEDAGPRWQPALEALRAAVDAGADREARSILERLQSTEPTGVALEIALAYQKILDGRAAVADLDLALEAEFERTPESGGVIIAWFSAKTRDPRAIDVAPGPCTLRVTQVSVDISGDETRSVETLPVAAPLRVLLRADAPVRLPLANMPFRAQKGALASRASFELELRSGAIFVDGRELPAMRWRVAPGEVVLLASDLSGQGLASASELADHVREGKADPETALKIAVRLPRSERENALNALASEAATIPEPALSALAPALRWLAPEENLGRDTDSWRAYLRRRARGMQQRPDLLLPRPKHSTIAGS